MCLVDLMENEDGETETECEEAELRQKVEALKQELRECRAELSKLQKQLNQSERLQKSTESYNEDLRKQVGEYTPQSFSVLFAPIWCNSDFVASVIPTE